MTEALLIVLFFLFSVVLTLASVATENWYSLVPSLVGALFLGWVIFSDSMNVVQTVGRVYWIVRNNAKRGEPIFSREAFMRSTDAPWVVGSGYQVRLLRYSFQIGTYTVLDIDNDEDGTLNAMQGRYMEDSAREIGNWK